MAFSHQKLVDFFEDAAQAMINNASRIMAALAALVLAGISVAGYMYFTHRAKAHAYKDLYYAMQVYDAPTTKTTQEEAVISFASEEEKWKKVEDVARLGWSGHSGPVVAQFGVLWSEALLKQGKLDEAIEKLDKAIEKVPSQYLKDFYILKSARMKIDSSNETSHQEGLSLLKSIAHDSNNYAHEAALYYLGYYFWDKKDYMQVKNYWRQLVVKYGLKDAKHQSGFADVAKQKLHLIAADI